MKYFQTNLIHVAVLSQEVESSNCCKRYNQTRIMLSVQEELLNMKSFDQMHWGEK